MSSISIFPVRKMWAKDRRAEKRTMHNDSSNISHEVPRNRRSIVRETNTRMVESVYSTLLTQQDIGSLPFGWERSPGTRVADGDYIRPIGGRGIDGGPRFDQPVNPGGYLWWYIDGTSENGTHAFSLIIFVGSVFSPYYSSAKKQNIESADPEDFCSFNLALYNQDKKIWTMTEFGKKYVNRKNNYFEIANSKIEWKNDRIEVDIDEIAAPFPKRVKGKIVLSASKFFLYSTWLDDDKKHRWGPLAPHAEVSVDFPSLNLNWQGHGYCDSNEGDEPLETPFHGWNWAKTHLEDDSVLVFYDIKQKIGRERVLPLRFFPDGSVKRIAPPPREDLPNTKWLIPRFMRAEPARPSHILKSLEDTPFYSRSMLSAGLLGDRQLVMHETLNLNRYSNSLVRSLLPWRMPRID